MVPPCVVLSSCGQLGDQSKKSHICKKSLFLTDLLSPKALEKFHEATELPDFLPSSRRVGREPWHSLPLLPAKLTPASLYAFRFGHTVALSLFLQ